MQTKHLADGRFRLIICLVICTFLVIYGTYWIKFGTSDSAQETQTDRILQPRIFLVTQNKDESDKSNYPKSWGMDFSQRLFSDKGLTAIYYKYVAKPKEYHTRYQWISNATWLPYKHPKLEDWEKKSICRAIECAEFIRILNESGLHSFDYCLSVDGTTDPEFAYITCRNHTDVSYSQKRVGDLYVMDLPFKQWNFVMMNQMMEHFYDPFIIFCN
ncbi:hypothetical protein RFI_28648, partial [Reticulomyxa filosa]